VRLPRSLALAVIVVGALGGTASPSALGSVNQEATFSDTARLLADPSGTLDTLRRLGVARVRVFVPWASIAPASRSRRRPGRFNATDPAAYPAANWTIWDTIVRNARARGIALDFNLGPDAPLWATGPGAPGPEPRGQWKPSALDYGAFVIAIGTRYSGAYTPSGSSQPLPRVDYWAIWNEPNFGPDLAPQATHNSTVEVGAPTYRALVDAGWAALQATGHGHDTILIGEVAARGMDGPPSRTAPEGYPGNFSMTKPLRFLRALYCVDARYRQLRGAAAALRGCPTRAAGSSRFRAAHPGLFQASGFANHPYSDWSPPTVEPTADPDFTVLMQQPRLERVLDRLQRIYGSGAHLPIYVTEYGYITRPPKPRRTLWATPSTAAYYDNWAEYLMWRDPRVRTLTQYLLVDPPPVGMYEYGGFASGLEFRDGRPKATSDAYRLPIYLPITRTRPGRRLEVWGCVRPARFSGPYAPAASRFARIEFRRPTGGPWQTLQSVPVTSASCYVDVRQAFGSSGWVRLAWSYPDGTPAYSRVERVTVR
jgi:hypothetical protein